MVDYSIYLVTGRELLPPGMDYFESLEESVRGGVTIVQIREKNTESAEFIDIALKSKEICDRYNVPILINDRVDVALAIKANGVHVGQSDMPVSQVRQLLPEGSIIGVSCNTPEHVKTALRDDVDYIGIGAVYGTKTKILTSPLIGVRGLGAMLEILDGTNIKAVAIGGIKSDNLLRTLHGSVSSTGHELDGVAVVSEIVASPEPRKVAERLSTIFRSFKGRLNIQETESISKNTLCLPIHPTPGIILQKVIEVMKNVRTSNPLVHQITNTVVATQSANVTLAVGGSPIMATEPEEMKDLAGICGALLINIGTMREEYKQGMQKAGYYANSYKKPVVFDPVGIGASGFRKTAVRDILDVCQASVIKGNGGELAALGSSSEVESKGVDSVGSGFKSPASFVRALARKERCVVVLTGPIDYISDGDSVIELKNGHPMLGQITGSGCILGSVIATYCATVDAAASKEEGQGKLVSGDMFLGAVAGVLVLTVAAELAVISEGVKGPGTFLSGLIDVLWTLKPEDVLERAKISVS